MFHTLSETQYKVYPTYPFVFSKNEEIFVLNKYNEIELFTSKCYM